ncbi:MMPL family transporter [Pokkaliibacter sp. MBI-7]|uniref:efflux RND transporter permease subunit n=1 Tax=Pokkaliibacter sp. MBI-7 TaxID=3040600 RepID=UPI00244A380E|nr:MMPL family transporter [Pokkaliibacter sp. MBI-7]MDH2432432.1 MMPL family transporter [Pokkaliibacter sp. MBI-7]
MQLIQGYLRLLERRYKLLIALVLLITLGFAYVASGLQTNATPYFLDQSHPSRQADQFLKSHFSGSGENLMIATRTEQASIYNADSLEDLHKLTLALEQLTLTNTTDVSRLQQLVQRLPAHDRSGLEFASPLQPRQIDQIRTLQQRLQQAGILDKADQRWLQEMQTRIHPVTKVRSLVRIESITANGDELDIHPLMFRVPADEAGRSKLAAEAQANGLLRDVMISRSPQAVNTLVELSIPQDDAPAMRRMYDATAALIEQLQLRDHYAIGGPPAIFAQTSATMEQDSNRFFPLILLVVMVVLGLLFRSPRSVLIPIGVAFLSVIWTLGSMVLLGFQQNIVSTMLPVFLIAIGVSDSVHFIAAYRHRGGSTADASLDRQSLKTQRLGKVLNHLTVPMLLTSLTTIGGFLSLCWTPIHFIAQFGAFVALGVAYAFIITLTLLPGLYLWLPAARQTEQARPSALMQRLIGLTQQLVTRHTRALSIGVIAVLILCGLGIQRLQIDNEMIGYFSSHSRVYQDNSEFKRDFGGAATLEFVLRAPHPGYFKQSQHVAGLEQVQQQLLNHPKVGAVYALPNFMKLMNKAMHGDDPQQYHLPAASNDLYAQYLFLYENSNGNEIFNVVDSSYQLARIIVFVKTDQTSAMADIVQRITPVIHQQLPEVEIIPAGFGEVLIATRDEIIYTQITSLLLSFAVVTALLLALFRSLRYALIGVIPLVGVVAGNFALLGWSGQYLDVGTAIVAPIAIGIGVDYAIYFLNHCRQHPGSNREAVADAIRQQFAPILFNTLVLGCGFLVLTFSSHQALINLGWLVSSTMLLSALFTFLVLPLCVLFGRKPPAPQVADLPGVIPLRINGYPSELPE